MVKRQKIEGLEPEFVAQGTITEDEFHGSTLDLLQAYNVIEQPGSPVGNSNTVGSGPPTGRDAGTKRVMEMEMSYK